MKSNNNTNKVTFGSLAVGDKFTIFVNGSETFEKTEAGKCQTVGKNNSSNMTGSLKVFKVA